MLGSIDMASALPVVVTIVAFVATAVPLLHALWVRMNPGTQRAERAG
jgi:hypothetical protein